MTAPLPPVVSTTRHGTVAVVAVANPPVNAQSRAVRAGLLAAVGDAIADDEVEAIVLIGRGATFSAGADIGELEAKRLDPPSPHDLHALIEGSPKPVIAALHGPVMGGGLELALAAHGRIAATGAKLGLPEVRLGLLPGAGGTQRLPRLVGATLALELMVTGDALPAAKALGAGLVDRVVDGDLEAAAVAFADEFDAPRPTRARVVDPASLPPEGFAARRAAVAARQGLALAPALIVDCVEAATALPFDDGLAFELERFGRCLASDQAAGLLHLFFAERRTGRVPGLDGVTPRPVATCGVLGAGTMGVGIAAALASAGLPVTVVERDAAALERGLSKIAEIFDGQAARGRLSAEAAAARKAQVAGSLDVSALGAVDLVIEAVFESLAIKREVMAELGRICRPGAILATNTSTLDVDVLAEASGRPADVVGLHFFSPAHAMRLLEVVRGRETAPEVLAAALSLARRLAKVPVVSGVCFGFIGNRMLEGYLREVDAMVLAGVAPARIDAALERFGMAMGPCRMMDLSGLDLGDRLVRESREQGRIPHDPAYRAMPAALVAAGRLGMKNGRGWFAYDGRRAIADPEVTAIAAATADRLGIAATPDLDEATIVDRCLLPLVNEAARLLDEGIAGRASDVDVVWTTGYGFPTLRGGPLHWAERRGLAAVVGRLEEFAGRFGSPHGEWAVAPLLARLAEDGRGFSDLDRGDGNGR